MLQSNLVSKTRSLRNENSLWAHALFLVQMHFHLRFVILWQKLHENGFDNYSLTKNLRLLILKANHTIKCETIVYQVTFQYYLFQTGIIISNITWWWSNITIIIDKFHAYVNSKSLFVANISLVSQSSKRRWEKLIKMVKFSN